MPLDTSIPLQVRQAQTESPINQMAKLYEMKQAQQANALNELKMQEYQRGLAEQESIKNKLSLAKSPEDVANVLLAHGKAKEASDYLKSAQETKNLGLTGLETEAKTRETALRTVEKRLNILGQGFGAVRNNPTPETALRVLKYVADNGAITPEQYDRYVADINANPDPARIKAMADEGFMTALSAKEQLPTFQMQSTGGATRVLGINPVTGQATVAPGSEAKLTATPGELLSAQTTRRGQDLANARELQRIEIEKGKNSPEYIAMKAKQEESGKAQAKFEAGAPQAIAKSEEALRKIDEMVGRPEIKDKSGKVVAKATAPHPGFSAAVGAGGIGTLGIPGIANYIHGTDAASFKARHDEVLGGAFMEAFNTLKGGGAITEKEGEKATSAITRMSTAQSEAEYIKAAREFQNVIREGVKVAKQRLASGGASTIAGAGAGVDTSNPLLK